MKHNNKNIIHYLRFAFGIILKSTPGYLICGIVLSIVGALVSFLTYSYMLKAILQNIEAGVAFEETIILVLFCFIIQILYSFFSTLFYTKMAPIWECKLSNSIKKLIYCKAINIDLECYDDSQYYNDFSKAVSKCHDHIKSVMNSVFLLTNVILGFSANIILLCSINPFLICFVLVPFSALAISIFINKINYKKDMIIKEEEQKQECIQRTFYLSDYAKDMRFSHMPSLMLKYLKESSNLVVSTIKQYGFSLYTLSLIKTSLIDICGILGSTLFSIVCALVFNIMTISDCVIVINLMGGFIESFISIGEVFSEFHKNALYVSNIQRFLEYPSKLVSGNDRLNLDEAETIQMNNVSFKYDENGEYVLKNINLKISPGEKVALVGENGAGKSTLIKILLRLYPYEGEILYGNKNIINYSLKDYRAVFSVVLQNHPIYSTSIAENIVHAPAEEIDEGNIFRALENVGLANKVAKFESGINTILTKEFDPNGEVLSGGEQQKLAISRIYYRKNKFLILDEPSSFLDPVSEYEFYKSLKKFQGNCGMIYISHRLSATVDADRIYYLENGEIQESGNHNELMMQDGKYAKMFKKQSENYIESE